MTTNVVSFSAFKNDRRASGEVARREIAAAERLAADKARIAAEVAAELGASPAAHILGSLVAEVATDPRNTKPAPRFQAAYCDPTNEVRGSKYEATRDLNSTEITARVRADIKAAQKAGRLPAGCKISCRKDSYSGGWAIRVHVETLPEGFRVTSPAYASWLKQFGVNSCRNVPLAWTDCMSEERKALIASLEAILAAYNRDNSDSMVDYFDTRFHATVDLDWKLRDDRQKAEVEASAGDYWAAECGA